MALLGFKQRFAGLVETGGKQQTIRAYRKGGRNPRPGEILHCYTGLRTKSCRKLGETVCTSVEQITVDMHGINVSGRWLSPRELESMAIADGFADWLAMRDFFHKEHGLDEPFTGLLIKW